MNKLLLGIFIFCSFFGIVFLAGIGEEISHVITGEGAKSICFDMNLKIQDRLQNGYLLFHTEFPQDKFNNVDEWYSWREFSEKIGGVVSIFFAIFFGFMIGLLISSSRNK